MFSRMSGELNSDNHVVYRYQLTCFEKEEWASNEDYLACLRQVQNLVKLAPVTIANHRFCFVE